MAYEYAYDIALSYASEEETFVGRVHRILESYLPSIFFAPARQAELVGQDMYRGFYDIYRYRALYVAAFVTTSYVGKPIPMHEASSALARRNDEGRNCFLPIYLDGTPLPQLPGDVLYIDARNKGVAEVADILIRRVEMDPLYGAARRGGAQEEEPAYGGVTIKKNVNRGVQTIIGRAGVVHIHGDDPRER